VLRASAGQDANALAPLVEKAVRAADAGIVAWDVATMDMRFGALTARRELAGTLLAGLAALAVLLAAAGVYAVFELLVQRRRREFGVRLALGANAAALQRAVTRDGLGIAAVCAGAGAIVAAAIAWKLGAHLPGLAFDSPLPYAGALLFTLGASALACWLPARSAARTEPMAALRQD
jgi:putative ABC transport system permease protein